MQAFSGFLIRVEGARDDIVGGSEHSHYPICRSLYFRNDECVTLGSCSSPYIYCLPHFLKILRGFDPVSGYFIVKSDKVSIF